MSTVVNAAEFLHRFATLSWQNPNDLLVAVEGAGIPAAVVIAYLDALIATPASLNDQTITGVTAAQGTAITSFLKSKQLVAT